MLTITQGTPIILRKVLKKMIVFSSKIIKIWILRFRRHFIYKF